MFQLWVSAESTYSQIARDIQQNMKLCNGDFTQN